LDEVHRVVSCAGVEIDVVEGRAEIKMYGIVAATRLLETAFESQTLLASV
jgi:hypothetical protein